MTQNLKELTGAVVHMILKQDIGCQRWERGLRVSHILVFYLLSIRKYYVLKAEDKKIKR